MKEPNIDIINGSAPYKVKKGDHSLSYDFMTDYGVCFNISFLYDDTLLEHEAYQFVIANVNHKPSPNDPKVKNTVLAIIEQFFIENNTILLYICETGDNRQSLRSRLFDRWFSTYNHRKYFTFLSSTVRDEEGTDNYVSLIIRNDNPNYSEVISDYAGTIQFFTNKP
jgi:hypothetical protein